MCNLRPYFKCPTSSRSKPGIKVFGAAAPNTFMPGFDLEEVGHLKYGRRLHIWDFKKKEPVETMYLGEDGLIPLEVKFLHNPDSSHGFCGAAAPQNP